MKAFIFLVIRLLLIFLILLILAVSFVNGFTDAPNAIASGVSTRSINVKSAVILAGISDFAGSMIMGLCNQKVTETVINIAYFGDNRKLALISLSAAMCSIVIWAVSAWRLGVPTSESHALIAGLIGASIAINGGFSGISSSELMKVLEGLIFSSLIGFISGYFFSKLTVVMSEKIKKAKTDRFFSVSQVILSAMMSFMHGAQDSQKFAGILILAISVSEYNADSKIRLIMLIVCSLVIALGTATGGERIIKSVGLDMTKLRKDQGFAADLSGIICLFISTIYGMPVSTTHTKTSAIMGVGIAKSIKSIDLRIASEMVLAWILTFPCCGLLSWLTTKIFLYIF